MKTKAFWIIFIITLILFTGLSSQQAMAVEDNPPFLPGDELLGGSRPTQRRPDYHDQEYPAWTK